MTGAGHTEKGGYGRELMGGREQGVIYYDNTMCAMRQQGYGLGGWERGERMITDEYEE